MKNRSRTEIITTILEIARNGTNKTKIMYRAFLSYSQLITYVKFLQKYDLLTHEEERQLYLTTEKGLKFLDMSNAINELVVSKPENVHIVNK